MLRDARVRAEGLFTVPADNLLAGVLNGQGVSGLWLPVKELDSGELLQVRCDLARDGSYEAQMKHADGSFVEEHSYVTMGLIIEGGEWLLAAEVYTSTVRVTVSASGNVAVSAGNALAELLKECGAAERGWVRISTAGLEEGQALVALRCDPGRQLHRGAAYCTGPRGGHARRHACAGAPAAAPAPAAVLSGQPERCDVPSVASLEDRCCSGR